MRVMRSARSSHGNQPLPRDTLFDVDARPCLNASQTAEGDRSTAVVDANRAHKLWSLLQLIAYLQAQASSAIVQLRSSSGTVVGMAVLSEGRLGLVRRHGADPEESREERCAPSGLQRFLRDLRASGEPPHTALEAAEPELVDELRQALRGRIVTALSEITETCDDRLRARWRPLRGRIPPTLSFEVLEIYEAIADRLGLRRRGTRSEVFFSRVETKADACLLFVRQSFGLVPVRAAGLGGAPLGDLVRLSMSVPAVINAIAAEALGSSAPEALSFIGPDLRWVFVVDDRSICAARRSVEIPIDEGAP